MNRLKISIIGAGNVAWHLSQVFEDQGHSICEVYSRLLSNAKSFCKHLFDTIATDNLDFSESKAQLFFLCVNDDALSIVLDQLELPNDAILIHTSGAKSIDILAKYAQNLDEQDIEYGVFYPLMTLSKGQKMDFTNVPLCIEASTENAENLLVTLGQSISKIVYLVESSERRQLHLAAVFANNFVNHLLVISEEILIDNDLDFLLLKPIIKETMRKALASDNMAEVQTGPARRGDTKTIKTHLEMLHDRPNTEKVYRVLSESIYNYYNQE